MEEPDLQPVLIEGPNPKPAPPSDAMAKAREVAAQQKAEEDERLRVMATALRLRGNKVREIAQYLGLGERRVRLLLRQARQDGNLVDTLADLQFEALPLAVEKLITKLENGDWDAIKETLKGLGAFRHYSQQDNAGQQDNRQLQVNFIMPPQPQALNPKGIVGTPRGVIDAVPVQGPAAEVPRDGGAGGDVAEDRAGVGQGDGADAGRLQEPA